MFYINTDSSEYPISEYEVRRRFPQTSFPAGPFTGVEGYARVQDSIAPLVDAATNGLRELLPVEYLGQWTQQWEVYALSADQIEAKRLASIPASVSPRQIRQALNRAGLRANVEAAVAAGDQDTKDWYEFATEFERSSPIVVALGKALGVPSLQLDDLWTLAAAL